MTKRGGRDDKIKNAPQREARGVSGEEDLTCFCRKRTYRRRRSRRTLQRRERAK